MTNIAEPYRALLTRILDGKAHAPREFRRAAYHNAGLDEPIRTLVEKVAHRAYQVTDDDVAAVRAAGMGEDQVFELVVCAAVGQASRQYDTALAALADATTEADER